MAQSIRSVDDRRSDRHCGFATFLLSGHELLKSIGVALSIGVGIAFLASLTLAQAILLLAGERLELGLEES